MEEKEISQTITKFLRGELNNEEIDQLWEEFLKNPELFNQFETEVNLYYMFLEQRSSSESSSQNKTAVIHPFKKYQKWIYAAAAAIILSIGLQLFSIDETDMLRDAAIASIDVTEMMGADIYRDESEWASDLDLNINLALAKALDDRFDEAEEILEQLLREELSELQSGKVHLNLGILNYNKASYNEAISAFSAVTAIETIPFYLEEKAWWFKGNAYLNINEIQLAREAVFNAYTLDGRFASPALALLKKLDIELEQRQQQQPG